MKNQLGRSMVEMLGVLAIIGVLSIGGIAGYRYAMQQIETNKVLDVFRYVYTAAFSAYYHPNSFTSCCSFDSFGLEGNYLTGCVQNGADWREQQRDEIKTYLPASYCATLQAKYCMLEGREWRYEDKRLGWVVYSVMRNQKPVLVISMYLPGKNKKNICLDMIHKITGDPIYSQNLWGIGTLFEASWNPKPDLSENSIQEICDSTSGGVAFYFNLSSLDQCDSQISN